MTKNSLFVFRTALVAALGGLLFGFDTAVISGSEQTLQRIYELSDNWLGFTVASALLGTILGSISVAGPDRPDGPPQDVDLAGDPLFRIGGWQCHRLELVLLFGLSFHRWPGGRWCLRGFPRCISPDLPGKESRTAGGPSAIQHRPRNPVSLHLELRDHDFESRRRRVAVDVRRRGGAGRTVFRTPVLDPLQPPLADVEGTSSRSTRGLERLEPESHDRGRRAAGHSRIAGPRAPQFGAKASYPRNTFVRFSWPVRSLCSISYPASMPCSTMPLGSLR